MRVSSLTLSGESCLACICARNLHTVFDCVCWLDSDDSVMTEQGTPPHNCKTAGTESTLRFEGVCF